MSCVSSAANSVAGDAFSSIAHAFAKAADSTINWLWGQLGISTAVHLGGATFDLDLGLVAAITGVVAVGLFVIQIISSTLRRDPGGLARAGKGLVVAFLAGGAAVGVTNLLLGAVDALSSGVVAASTGTTMSGMGSKVLPAGALETVSNPAAMMLLSLAAIAAVAIVWFALTIRKVLIVVSAVFAPLAFAGSLADITVSWTRRWIEIMLALIFSKLMLVLIFVIGWGVLDGAGQAGSGGGQTTTQMVSGLLILGVAGLAPWMALKLVHFSGDQLHHLHGLAGAATSGAQKAATMPQKAAAWKSSAASLGAGGLAGTATARGAASSARNGPGSGGPARSPMPGSAGSPEPAGPRTPSGGSIAGEGLTGGSRTQEPAGASPTPAVAQPVPVRPRTAPLDSSSRPGSNERNGNHTTE